MAGRKPSNPPREKQGFVTITHIPCPACLDRDDLTTDGRARIVGGGQLRGASRYVGLTKASIGCEVCEGRGWMVPTDLESIDPYALKKSA